MTLRVGIGAAPFRPEAVEFVRQAERLGVDSVWCPEFWAGDAFTPLAYLAASTSTIKLGSGIAQLGARTPAMLAMTAQSLHAVRRAVPPRHRNQRAAGDGRLARRRVRQAVRRTRRPSRSSAITAGGGSTTTGRSTTCRCPAARRAPSGR